MSSEEKKEDLEETLEDYEEEYEDLMDELEDIKDEIEEILEDIRDLEEDLFERQQEKEKAETEIKSHKIENKIHKLKEEKAKLKSKLAEAKKKEKETVKKIKVATHKIEEARKKYVRMNISLPSNMKEDWKDLADDINTSVSELIRSAVGAVGPALKNLKSIKDLERLGDTLDKWGEDLEEEFKRSGIEELGKNLEINLDKEYESSRAKPPKSPTPPTPPKPPSYQKKYLERIKKRIYGLIKLQKSLPISKLAQVLSISEEKAENLIYELAAEGIEGQLEENVFKFKNPSEEVIEKVYDLIEKMYETER